ncbi:MAG TPA: NADH-quinone oxidoreductase subunit I, partial [Gordonia polyisoprenivorans]|nr:NADH-quinone oxidoreductase subunit I [Gordonia polyisoprenivorans]
RADLIYEKQQLLAPLPAGTAPTPHDVSAAAAAGTAPREADYYLGRVGPDGTVTGRTADTETTSAVTTSTETTSAEVVP